MTTDDDLDRLVDLLLSEELGGERPPDLADKVLARAFGRRRGALWIAAAAAAVLVAIGLWALLAPSYPEPLASGSYLVVGGGKVRRGSTIVRSDAPATLTLGGYCRIELDPRTAVVIEGQPRAEQVFLERGGVACKVDSQAGTFAVRTDAGTASVAGTEFCVQLIEDDAASGKRVLVRVAAGAVTVSGAWGESRLAAGEERVFPEKAPEPEPPSKKPPARELDVSPAVGTLKSVDAKARTIVLTVGEGDEARGLPMRVCPRAVIRLNGKDATLADVRHGAKVRVVFNKAKNEERIAVRLEVAGCAPQ
ncbi:MAG: FecR domain-containing protein [Planctomycetes bacterium]|nr:FecR domain-containing protein [Planctomycetota bacterium]